MNRCKCDKNRPVTTATLTTFATKGSPLGQHFRRFAAIAAAILSSPPPPRTTALYSTGDYLMANPATKPTFAIAEIAAKFAKRQSDTDDDNISDKFHSEIDYEVSL